MRLRSLPWWTLSLLLAAACGDDGGGGGTGGAGGLGTGAAGGGSGGSAGDGGSGGGTGEFCYTSLPPTMFDKSCSAAADCALKFHMVDCCGSLAAVGISQTDSVGFDAAEQQCQAICDCLSQPTIADDGMTSDDPAAFHVDCVANECSTYVQ